MAWAVVTSESLGRWVVVSVPWDYMGTMYRTKRQAIAVAQRMNNAKS